MKNPLLKNDIELQEFNQVPEIVADRHQPDNIEYPFQEFLQEKYIKSIVYDQTPAFYEQPYDYIFHQERNVFVSYQAMVNQYNETPELNKPSSENLFQLKNLNLKINQSEKSGLVGRTGAGKSTFIQTLLKLVELYQGQITIDRQDIKNFKGKDIRRQVSIIPQVPVICKGSIRRNLDPFSEFTDEQIYNVLEKVQLKEKVQSFGQKLQTDMSKSSNIFSVGQKQLISIGRVLLKQSKIVLLDEATSNIDRQTDEFIQTQLVEMFQGKVLIIIARRLTTILHCDRILVLSQGQLVEQGNPYSLLAKMPGDNIITNKETAFAKLVLETGAASAQKILETAKEIHFEGKKQFVYKS